MKKAVVLLALSLHFFMTTAQSAQDLKYVIAKSAADYIQYNHSDLESFENVYVQCKLLYLCDNNDNKSLVPLLVEEAPILQIHNKMLELGMDIKDYPIQKKDRPRHFRKIIILVDKCSPDSIDIRLSYAGKRRFHRRGTICPDCTYLYWTYDAAEKQWNVWEAPYWWGWN